MGKITEAWERLKMITLSKAIAMAPEVTSCTIGPKRPPLEEEEPDADYEQPDLSKAVTSTPLKPRKPRRVATKDHNLEVSEIKKERENNLITEEIVNLELVKQECLRKFEIQITRLTDVSSISSFSLLNLVRMNCVQETLTLPMWALKTSNLSLVFYQFGVMVRSIVNN